MSHVLDMLSELQLPHWLIIAGSALVALGIVGLIIRRGVRAPKTEEDDDTARPDRAEVEPTSPPADPEAPSKQ